MSELYVGISGVIVADRSVGIRRYLNKNTDRYLPTGSLMKGSREKGDQMIEVANCFIQKSKVSATGAPHAILPSQ